MRRRPRFATASLVYHVLNRRVGRLGLFETERDYAAFERILEEAVARKIGEGDDSSPPSSADIAQH